VPPGFDRSRIGATRRALLRKRAAAAAGRWPLLAEAHGRSWSAAFAAHHDGRPPAGALRDGWDLARALRARGGLRGGAAVELAEREVVLRYDGRREPRRRRLPAVRVAAGLLLVRVGRRIRTVRFARRSR
jgi:hypothetical protein